MKYTKEFLENLIGEPEGLKQEFKSAKSFDKPDVITKVVSSFANATGGVFYLGIAEDPKDERASHLDPIDIAGKKNQKERLEQIILSNVFPSLLNGLRIFEIEIEPNKVIYVIEVDESYTAHQAKDLRYHARYNFTTRALHDHEIALLKNKNIRPDLEPTLSSNLSVLRIYLNNKSKFPAKNIQMCIEPNFIESGLRLSTDYPGPLEKIGKNFILTEKQPARIVYDKTHTNIANLAFSGIGTGQLKFKIYAENMIHKCYHYSITVTSSAPIRCELLSSHIIEIEGCEYAA